MMIWRSYDRFIVIMGLLHLENGLDIDMGPWTPNGLVITPADAKLGY